MAAGGRRPGRGWPLKPLRPHGVWTGTRRFLSPYDANGRATASGVITFAGENVSGISHGVAQARGAGTHYLGGIAAGGATAHGAASKWSPTLTKLSVPNVGTGQPWQLNGNSGYTGSDLYVTHNGVGNSAGTAFWTQKVNTDGLTITWTNFYTYSSTAADASTFILLDGTQYASPNVVGGNSTAGGFDGLKGFAWEWDEWTNYWYLKYCPANTTTPTTLATLSDSAIYSYGTSPHVYSATFTKVSPGVYQATLLKDGAQIFGNIATVNAPDTCWVGFGGSTGGYAASHIFRTVSGTAYAILPSSNVSSTSTTTTPQDAGAAVVVDASILSYENISGSSSSTYTVALPAYADVVRTDTTYVNASATGAFTAYEQGRTIAATVTVGSVGDNIQNAISLNGVETYTAPTYTIYNGSNETATAEANEPNSLYSGYPRRTVWYKYVAPAVASGSSLTSFAFWAQGQVNSGGVYAQGYTYAYSSPTNVTTSDFSSLVYISYNSWSSYGGAVTVPTVIPGYVYYFQVMSSYGVGDPAHLQTYAGPFRWYITGPVTDQHNFSGTSTETYTSVRASITVEAFTQRVYVHGTGTETWTGSATVNLTWTPIYVDVTVDTMTTLETWDAAGNPTIDVPIVDPPVQVDPLTIVPSAPTLTTSNAGLGGVTGTWSFLYAYYVGLPSDGRLTQAGAATTTTLASASTVIVDMGALPAGVDGYVLYVKRPGDSTFTVFDTTTSQQVIVGPVAPSPVSAVISATSGGLLPAGNYTYTVHTYQGDISLAVYSAAAVTNSVTVAAGGIVTVQVPSPVPNGQVGYVVVRNTDNVMVASGSSPSFTDDGRFTVADTYTPPPQPTVPDFLLNPPEVNYTGQNAITITPIYLSIADYTTPTFDRYGRPINWVETTDANNHTELGRLRVLVNNVDVTFFRGVEAIIHGWTDNEPFGDASAEIEFPQISPFEHVGIADMTWAQPFAPVALQLVVSPGVSVVSEGVTYTGGTSNNLVPLFDGIVPSWEDRASESDTSITMSVIGTLYQLDYYVKSPIFTDVERDIGTRIAASINEKAYKYGFRGAPCHNFEFGITTRQGGAWEKLLTGFIQNLLALVQTTDGKQGTLTLKRPRTPFLKWKDMTTVHWSAWTGQPGVTFSLTRDWSTATNVIYGEGTDDEGCHWRNTKYPNLHPDTAPLYPLSPPTVYTPGSAYTGFDPFADRMRNNGYTMYSADTYDARDEDEVRNAQKVAGILVDGIVGPQTWAAVFQVGSNEGDLNGAFFMPIAENTAVEPYVYNPQGGILGPNPRWNPQVARIETYENYGDHITKREAAASAQQELKRDQDPGWTGTITLTADLTQGSRLFIHAGQNIKLEHFRGGPGALFHIAQVDRDLTAEPPSVTLTVDTKARDLMTIAAIMERNRETHNPANQPQRQLRSSKVVTDTLVVWDCENGAGVIPKHAQYAGLWTVMRIPAGSRGTVAKTHIQTFGPASPFAVAIFGKPVTANQLASLLGNPVGARSDASNPWDTNAETLDNMGYLYAVGGPNAPAGYYPTNDTTKPANLTGWLKDDSSWVFESWYAPWIWVAVWTQDSCYVEGRLYPGTDT